MGFRNWLIQPLINQGNLIMASIADIQAKTDKLIAEVKANTDATGAVTTYVTGLKSQLTELQSQLDAALAAGNQSALQDVSDKLDTVISSIDADTVAEAALAGTPAAPTAADPGTTAAPAPADPTST